MSAVPQEDSQSSSDSSGTHTFRFKQDVPIPSYLLALAVGELEHRQIGPRSKVGPLPDHAWSSYIPNFCTSPYNPIFLPALGLKRSVFGKMVLSRCMCWPLLLLELNLSHMGHRCEVGPWSEMYIQTLLAPQVFSANLSQAQSTFPTYVHNA